MNNLIDRQSVQQRFRRRFAFNTHAAISIIGMILLTILGLSSRRYIIQAQIESTLYYQFVGLNPVPFLLAIGMGVALTLHSIIYRNQEAVERGETGTASQYKRRRRTLFSLHSLLAIAPLVAAGVLAIDLQRVVLGVDATGHEAILEKTQLPFAAIVIPLILLVLLIPHGIRLLYAELLERTVQRETEQTEQLKLKNEQQDTNWAVGDDGELFLQNDLEQGTIKNKKMG